MTEVVVFPDVEALLVSWLPAQLAARSHNVTVSTRVPSVRPASFVRVVLVGGARNNLVQDDPRVVYEAWADDETAAVTLAQLTRGLIHSLAGQVVNGTQIYRVDDYAAPSNNPDPISAQVRYSGTVAILLRGSAQ